ncbi:hypothetical protein MPSEU_000709300 [Mayamaea pseudoterrestris]|nr:hypothetical protein MPSEU_000709300 [Mayamaea pseudoterrestris]
MKFTTELIVAASLAVTNGFVAPSKSRRPFAVSHIASSWAPKPSTTTRRLAEEDLEDDEDDYDMIDSEGPLSKGIESVSWLPSVVKSRASGSDSVTKEDVEIIPLFPLGGIVYIPNSEQILNIFEPRYRAMYSDILMNGSKKFAVSMSHPTEEGRFAEMGVLFELEDLKEVSEQTGDKIKYICSHKVTGRVKIHRIVNPDVWASRDTYLRVEATVYDDSGKTVTSDSISEDNVKEEKALRDSFAELVDLQHALEEDVRFTRESVASLATKPGAGASSLWQTIRLWHSFAEQRLMARQNELQRDFQEKLQLFLKKQKGLKDEEMPSVIGFQDLSAELQKEVQELQKRMAIELQPLTLESMLSMQMILEKSTHTSRLELLRWLIETETKRLNTKRTLQNLFSNKGGPTDLSKIPPEELMIKPPSVPDAKTSFYEDEDAFQ